MQLKQAYTLDKPIITHTRDLAADVDTERILEEERISGKYSLFFFKVAVRESGIGSCFSSFLLSYVNILSSA